MRILPSGIINTSITTSSRGCCTSCRYSLAQCFQRSRNERLLYYIYIYIGGSTQLWPSAVVNRCMPMCRDATTARHSSSEVEFETLSPPFPPLSLSSPLTSFTNNQPTAVSQSVSPGCTGSDRQTQSAFDKLRRRENITEPQLTVSYVS